MNNKDLELEQYCGCHTDCGNRCDKCEQEKKAHQYKRYDEWFDDENEEDFSDEEFSTL